MSESWQEWLAAYRATEPMTCELVPLMDICTEAAEPNPERRWGIQLDGNFRRPDGGFFKFVGARIRAGTREIGQWVQPMLQEAGVGACVLLRHPDSVHFLVQAKAEPGNPASKGHVLLAPSFQASMSNLVGAHGGSKVPHTDFIKSLSVQMLDLPQDGGRFFEKSNGHGIAFGAPHAIDSQRERWFTKRELTDAVLAGECNEHLVQVLLLATFRGLLHLPA